MIGLAAETALKYAVVVKHGNWQVGVLVDTVPEIRTLSKDQFLPAPIGTGDGVNPFVSTVVKLEDRLRGVLGNIGHTFPFRRHWIGRKISSPDLRLMVRSDR